MDDLSDDDSASPAEYRPALELNALPWPAILRAAEKLRAAAERMGRLHALGHTGGDAWHTANLAIRDLASLTAEYRQPRKYRGIQSPIGASDLPEAWQEVCRLANGVPQGDGITDWLLSIRPAAEFVVETVRDAIPRLADGAAKVGSQQAIADAIARGDAEPGDVEFEAAVEAQGHPARCFRAEPSRTELPLFPMVQFGAAPDEQTHPDLYAAWFAAWKASIHALFIDSIAACDNLADAKGTYAGFRNALLAELDARKRGAPPTPKLADAVADAKKDDVPVTAWWRNLQKHHDKDFAAPVQAVSTELTAAAHGIISVGGLEAPNAHLAAVRLLEWRWHVIQPAFDLDTVEHRWPEIRKQLLQIARLAEWSKLAALMEREWTLVVEHRRRAETRAAKPSPVALTLESLLPEFQAELVAYGKPADSLVYMHPETAPTPLPAFLVARKGEERAQLKQAWGPAKRQVTTPFVGGALRGLGGVTIHGTRYGVVIYSGRATDTEKSFAELANRAGAVVPLADREAIGATAFEPPALWVALMVHEGREAGFVGKEADGTLVVKNYFAASVHAIEQLSKPAKQAAAEPADDKAQPTIDKKTQAIAALLTIGPNPSKIARTIGVPRTTLLGWPEFRLRYDQVKADAEKRKGRLPRGNKSKGSVEAWQDDDNDVDE